MSEFPSDMINVIGGKSPFQSPSEIYQMQWVDLKVSPSRMWKYGYFFIYSTADALPRLELTTLFGEPYLITIAVHKTLAEQKTQYPDYSEQNPSLLSDYDLGK